MDLDKLRKHLEEFAKSLQKSDKQLLSARLNGLASAFPFNEYEFMLMFLREKEIITFAQYDKLRSEYVSGNRYLNLFELAPRIFGEIWGQEHIRDLDARFLKPSKDIDPEYKGDYDVWMERVKVEVKAARAINTKKRGPLVSKALRYDSPEPFWMNFQQIKLDVADVFVFIGVWVDRIIYWVLSNDEAKKDPHMSHQHRGGIEYQIGITERNIHEYDKYAVSADKVAATVLKKLRKK